MRKSKKILLVEDDINFGSVLKSYLELNDFNVTLSTDGMQGYNDFKSNKFDICVLDIMMPYKDGITLAKEIKEIDPSIPIVFLTAKTLKEDIVQGYKVGADDYLTKPFDSELLLYKLKAILNRSVVKEIHELEKTEYSIGNYSFNPKTRLINFKDQTQKLSPKESQLLKLFCEKINNVLTREEALNKIWKDDNYFNARSMDVFIFKLRKYLNKDKNVQIINLHSNGFMLEVNR